MSRREDVLKALIFLSPVAAVLFSALLGRYPLGPREVYESVLAALAPGLIHSPSRVAEEIVVYYRLPRILTAGVVGAALSVSGAGLQAMFRNPLVSPYILGISAGAGFGAALAIAFLPPNFPVEVTAFAFGVLAFTLTLMIARAGGGEIPVISLILSGIIVTALFTAALSLVKFVAPNPHRLAAIVFWLMGSFANSGWGELSRLTPLVLASTAVLVAMRWRFNVLSLSDEEVKALGINPMRDRLIALSACALATSSSVAVAGIIGWAGLMIPHIVRLALGPDNRVVIPCSAVLGATYMILADDVARCLTPEEIPIGIITTLLGVPLFAYLLRRASRVWR